LVETSPSANGPRPIVDLSSEVLAILNEQGFLRDSIERVLAAVKARTGFDAVNGIRLEGGTTSRISPRMAFHRIFSSRKTP